MEDMTFSRIILQILREQNITIRKLRNDLNDLGVNITYSSLYSYYTGKVVPPLEVSKKILNAENIKIDDEDLKRTLNYSKKIQKAKNEDDNEILNLNLKIKSKTLSSDFSSNSKLLKSVIEMRANELFGDDNLVTQFSVNSKRKTSAYVGYLIKRDLENNGYINKK